MGVKTRRFESPVSVQYELGYDRNKDTGEDADGRSISNGYFNENGLMCTFVMRTLDAMWVS